MLERTVGRQIYAVGGNKEAARLAGIPTGRRITSTYVYVADATPAGVVGVLVIGGMNVADPSVGAGWELTAIAAAVVGGMSLSGGEGRVAGIAAGAILLEFITDGLLALKVSPYDQQVVQGAVLGGAILLDRVRARYFGRSRSRRPAPRRGSAHRSVSASSESRTLIDISNGPIEEPGEGGRW